MFILSSFIKLVECFNIYEIYTSIQNKDKDCRYYRRSFEDCNISTFFLPQELKLIYKEETLFDIVINKSRVMLGHSEFNNVEILVASKEYLKNIECEFKNDSKDNKKFELNKNIIEDLLESEIIKKNFYKKEDAKVALNILKEYYLYHDSLNLFKISILFFTQGTDRSPRGLYVQTCNSLYTNPQIKKLNKKTPIDFNCKKILFDYIEDINKKIKENLTKFKNIEMKLTNNFLEIDLKNKIYKIEDTLKSSIDTLFKELKADNIFEENLFNFFCLTFKDYYILWKNFIEIAQDLEYNQLDE